MTTNNSFSLYIDKCLNLFIEKNKDYGVSWRVLRPSSLTDQILIKASRIRSIDEKGNQKVKDPMDTEFLGLINYSIMALIQLSSDWDGSEECTENELKKLFLEQADKGCNLLSKKNHDYGEIWRMMRLSSIIDIILMKVYRIKRIEENLGKTVVSEGIDANYLDIINYSIFALIKLETNSKT